jgi:hypothetical protein
MKVSLLFRTKHFCPYLASCFIGVTQTSHVALCTTASQAVQVSSKSGRNEGHITLEVERPIHLYVASHCSEVKQTSRMAVSPHDKKPMHVRSKSGSIEGQIAIETEKAFVPTTPRIAAG